MNASDQSPVHLLTTPLPEPLFSEAADAVRRGVDVWDMTAHLESNGFSTSVARSNKVPSVFELARRMRALVSVDTSLGAAEAAKRTSVLAAILRSVVMVGGVIICVSTLPKASEMTVFAIAASGWLAGQAVSAVIWYAWARGDRPDGVRAGVIAGGVMLLAGVAAAVAVQEWTLLIWVGWAAAIPTLQVLVPGWRLTIRVLLGGAVCALAWLSARGIWWPQPDARLFGLVSAAVLTIAAIGVACWRVRRELSRTTALGHPGTGPALAVALVQTLAQLGLLLVLFQVVGASAFGAVAVAGLAAGVLADPLFAGARRWSEWVVRSSTSWVVGRLKIAIGGVLAVVVMLIASAQTAELMLSDPYRIYLNEPTILMATVLAGAVIAATNVLLRTGAAVGAMLVAVVAALVTAAALLLLDESIHSLALFAVMIGASIFAALAAAERLSHPRAW